MSRLLLAVLALGIVPAAFAADPKDAKPESVIGTKAPSLTLTALDGTATKLDTLRGKAATVVVFVSFECPVSNSYVAGLNELARTHAEKGVTVVLVAPTDEPLANVVKAAAGFKPKIPVLHDPKKELAAGLKAIVTPEAFLLDANGVVQYRGRIDDAYAERLKRNAKISSTDLQDALDAVLTSKPVAKTVTPAIGCAIDYTSKAPKTGAVTYYRDVAAILNNNCVVCHRTGEVGPFPLTTYKQARRWASDIAFYTGNKQMPPWPAAGGLPMRGERKLSAEDIATLARWAEADAPEGNPADAPKAPDFGNEGWRYGKPDLIITPGDDFRLGGNGDDLFRVFVVPTGLKEDKWVIGYDVKPGNPRVVHHTLHYFETTGKARELEVKQQEKEKGKLLMDGGPGYNASMGVGFIPSSGTKDNPTFGGIGGWAPGQLPQMVPQGMGWLLPKGSDFLIQTHYHRNGQYATDRTRVGLYFAKSPIDQPWQTIVVNGLKANEKIQAGDAKHHARGSMYLYQDAVLHNVLPHMHLLGKWVKVTMTPPGGTETLLIEIPAWDYRWQETYWFKEPIHAKAGTRLSIEAVYDNSAANPNNPTKPPRTVMVGDQTTDEMLFGFFGVTSTKTPWEQVRTSAYPPPYAGVAFDLPAKGEMTPELERRIGDWTSVTIARPAGGAETKLTGTQSVVKAYDGKYLLVKSEGRSEGSSNFDLVTFDQAKKAYRMWTYTTEGMVIEWDGAWDDKASTFTWKTELPNGAKGTMRWNCSAKDTMEQEFKIGVGFITGYTATGTYTRK